MGLENQGFEIYLAQQRTLDKATERIEQCRKDGGKMLDLGGLGLSELPESVRTLRQLESLDIQSNYIATLPPWIAELSHLTNLDWWNNGPVVLPEALAALPRLGLLNLGDDPGITGLEVLRKLPSLPTLGLEDMDLTTVPEALRTAKNLEVLALRGNRLTELPEWASGWTALRELHLDGNPLSTLPGSLSALKQLRVIRLKRCNFTTLPAVLHDLPKLITLDLRDNPKLPIPDSILEGEDAKTILAYAKKLEKPSNRARLDEFKLVLVGRGLVGKTTLVHRLVEDKYKEFKRTPGVKITDWDVKCGKRALKAHVWDFGGQEIMHGTHRCFMTERALYLVLISGREGTEEQDANYWLSMVRSFAGDVPVVVLLHKWADWPFQLNQRQLRERYGEKLIFLQTDSETGHGIAELRKELSRICPTLPGIEDEWPAQWRTVKDALPQKKKSWLRYEDFREFCRDHGVPDEDHEQLAESLHALGLMLSFRKDEALRGFGVLNPKWATDGIYQMLNARPLHDSQGKFNLGSFAEVLSERTYPKELHPYLLALMRKFHLCHPLDDAGKEYLIPELLTREEPALDLTFPPAECLGFAYYYKTILPEGLMSRFIVDTYVMRWQKYAWRTGVLLSRNECRAAVRGDLQKREITIRVNGPQEGRRELLALVRRHFEKIHATYKDLQVEELVPLPGFPEERVSYAELCAFEAEGEKKYKKAVGGKVVTLDVVELLDGVTMPGAAPTGSMVANLVRNFGAFTGDKPLSLFISYSQKDDRYRDQFDSFLEAYGIKGEIERWTDTRIESGQKWEPEILGNLESADIIVLLLSTDFIRTNYCMQVEAKRALERAEKGECAVVPIVIRACPFEKLELGTIQAIPPNRKPVKEHRDRDKAWKLVCGKLELVFARLRKGKR